MAYDFENSPFASLFGMSDYTPSDYAANAGNTFNFADTMSPSVWDSLLSSSTGDNFNLGDTFNTGSLSNLSDLFSVTPSESGAVSSNNFLKDLGLSNELQGFNTSGLEDILNQNSNSLFGYGLDKPEDIDNILQSFGLSPDKITEMDINWQGKNDLYDVLKQQLDQGLITEEQANNFYQGLTSDGKPYDFRSPQQAKAFAAQLQQALKSGAIDRGAAARIVQAIKGDATGTGGKLSDLLKKNPVGALKALTKAGEFAALLGGLHQKAPLVLKARGSAAPVSWGGNSQRAAPKMYAKGGPVGSGLGSVTVMLADKARAKGLIPGAEGGQDDNVDARLSPGEYVMDAESVSALGDGNTEAGAKKLDKMRHSIRKHKRQGGLSSIPPKAKEPEAYLKG